MPISREEVKKIAHLARLGLDDAQLDHAAEQLSSILDYVAQLQSVDTKGVEPIAQITGLENQLRVDEVRPVDPSVRKGLLASAPAVENDLVKTKAVFE